MGKGKLMALQQLVEREKHKKRTRDRERDRKREREKKRERNATHPPRQTQTKATSGERHAGRIEE